MKIEFIKMKFKYALTILAVFFYSNIVNAQNALNNIGLTSSTPASVAYSLRLLSSSYAGPLVRIKVGTSFYDVYPDLSTNKFSLSSKISASISTYNAAAAAAGTNALSTIISGSTDATVAIWYDQSGNGVHVLSSSATAKIITAGNILTMSGQPTINFYGSSSYLTSSTTVNYSSQTNATVNAAAQDVASTNYISGILTTGDNGGWGLCYDPTTTIKGYWVDASGGNGAFSNENSTEPKIITGTIGTPASGTSSAIYLNSSLKGTKAAQNLSNGTTDKIYVGSRGNFAGRQFIGNISETIMFPKTLSASEQSTLESSQSIFLPIPISVTITSSASGTICAGTSVTFTATVTGISSPTYQWTKNGIGIPGANSSTYTTTTLSNNDVIKVWVNAGINPSSIVSNGLILNLDASNPGSYSGTGNTWYDLSGNNKHGTLMNSPTYDAASGSIVTNGTNQYISIPQVSTANTNITMQAWVYVNLNTTGTFIKNGTGGGGYSIGIGNWAYDQVGSNVVMLLYGRGWIGSGVSYGTAGWKLVTLTLDGSSTAKAYVNGSLIGTYTWPTPTSPSGPLNLGANIGDGNIYYNGKFAAAYFYNRELSLAEIQQNYNAFATKTTAYGSNSITVSISGSTPTLSVSGDACVNKTTLSTTSGLTAYAWYKDDVAISGATSNSYTPTASGAYKVLVTTGSCSSTSTTTTIYNCAVGSDGKMITISNASSIISPEGGANFGTGRDINGKLFNVTGLTTVSGTIGSTTAIIGGIISPTNSVTNSIGVIYSTDINFGTYSSTTIQSNVAAGTYSTTITGLAATTNYFAKTFIVNKAGTSYGPVVNFTTSTPPVAVGDVYGGGIVFYVLQSGDAGYDANVQHGLIAATANQSNGVNWAKTASVTGATGTAIGTGLANTNLIITNQGNTGSYAAKIARDYTGGGYADWYLPSAEELHKMVGLTALNLSTYYHSSTEYNSSNAIYEGLTIGDFYRTPGTGSYPSGTTKTGNPLNVRAIRSF